MQHRRRFLTAIIALVILLAVPAPAIVGVAGATMGGSLTAVDADAPDDDQGAASVDAAPLTAAADAEMALIDLTNADRVSNGVAGLSFGPALLDIARQRAVAQLNGDPLSHYDGNGQLAFVGLLANAGVDYTLAGENLARTTGSDPGMVVRVEQALMNSPTHRKNILEPSFNEVAIGMASDASGRVTFAEIYRATP